MQISLALILFSALILLKFTGNLVIANIITILFSRVYYTLVISEFKQEWLMSYSVWGTVLKITITSLVAGNFIESIGIYTFLVVTNVYLLVKMNSYVEHLKQTESIQIVNQFYEKSYEQLWGDTMVISIAPIVIKFLSVKRDSQYLNLILKYLKISVQQIKSKDNFIHSMNQQLKNPLNNTLGCLDLVIKNSEKDSDQYRIID